MPVSGLLAIMSMGIIINQKYDVLAKRLSVKYNKLWLGAEIFLFVLVGIAVDLKYALAAGVVVILLVILALVFRMMGVAVSLVKTKLNKKERLFCMVAYTPKATVQAALGTVPLTSFIFRCLHRWLLRTSICSEPFVNSIASFSDGM